MSEKEAKETKQELHNLVNSCLDDWDDEIPKDILHSIDNVKAKVRKGWFQGLVGIIDSARELNVISEETAGLCQKFNHEYITRDFSTRLTTAEDIERGNEVLEAIKTDIENN